MVTWTVCRIVVVPCVVYLNWLSWDTIRRHYHFVTCDQWIRIHGPAYQYSILPTFQQDRQCTCNVNIEARSCNLFWGGKAISITYSECAFIALSIQHWLHMRHIVVCSLPGSTIIFHFISYITSFRKKKSYQTLNACFDFLYNFVWNIFTRCSSQMLVKL
jgi:hypothetical protein